MKQVIIPLLLAGGLAILCSANWNWGHWAVHEEDTIEKTLTLSGSSERLVVKNVQGYVHVTGTSGSQIRITAHRVIRAESSNDIQEAKNDVRLDILQEPDTVSVSYKTLHAEDWHRNAYDVVYNLDIEAPRQVQAIVSDVSGDIQIDKSSGRFDVRNVSGGIHMADISGSGSVTTVNGSIDVRFAKNPEKDTDFKTINGRIRVSLQPDLSANLIFSTLNGEIYSAFDVALRSVSNGSMHRIDRTGSGVVGRGGPDLRFKTLNGSIELHKASGGGGSSE